MLWRVVVAAMLVVAGLWLLDALSRWVLPNMAAVARTTAKEVSHQPLGCSAAASFCPPPTPHSLPAPQRRMLRTTPGNWLCRAPARTNAWRPWCRWCRPWCCPSWRRWSSRPSPWPFPPACPCRLIFSSASRSTCWGIWCRCCWSRPPSGSRSWASWPGFSAGSCPCWTILTSRPPSRPVTRYRWIPAGRRAYCVFYSTPWWAC